MSRYSAVHANPKGPGDERPTALDIVKDNKLEGQLKDKVIVMTGASAGIGIETARAFSSTGARCFLGVRNVEKGAEACASFLEPGRVELFQIDTSSLASVRKAAAEVLQKSGNQVNILVHNAGIMANPTQEISVDGFEIQFATNYLGHFLFFRLLEKALISSSTPSFHSRVVNVSSSGHQGSGVVFGNMRLDNGEYHPWKAYGQSKTAMIYMTNHIERLYGSSGVHGYSLMPGGIRSNLQKHVDPSIMKSWNETDAIRNFWKNTEQGASTTVYAALDRDTEGKGGIYLEDCAVAEIKADPTIIRYAAPHAFDEVKEKQLWDEASKLVGL